MTKDERQRKAAYFHAYFESERPRRPARFGVISAYNPNGRKASLTKNRAADARLKRRLETLGLEHFRVTGGSRDGLHREPGWGIVVSGPAPLRRLTREFRQDAYFWIKDGRILLGAATGGPFRIAGSWRSRRARWARG